MKKILLVISLFFSVGLYANQNNLTMSINANCRAYMSNIFKSNESEHYSVTISNDIKPFDTKDVVYQLRSDSSTLQLYKEESDSLNGFYFMRQNSKKPVEKLEFKNTEESITPNRFKAYVNGYILDFSLNEYFMISDAVNINTFDTFLQTKKLTLDIKKKITTTQQVKEEIPPSYFDGYTMINGKYTVVTPKKKYQYIDKKFITFKTTHFNIIDYDEAWKNAKEECSRQIDNDNQEILIKQIGATIGIVILLYIVYRLIRKLIKYAKAKAVVGKEKLEEYKKKKEEGKVRKIAEEESIRATVQKSINKSEDDELEALQELINKAVAKGDSETAKSLLKILNSKKDK